MHCHVIPGVDDGAPDMQTSLQMLQMQWDEGIDTVIATPHYVLMHNRYSYHGLEETFAGLQAECRKILPGMKLYLGNEVLYDNGIMERLRRKRIHTLAGTRCLLLEFNVRAEEEMIRSAVRECTNIGYKPVLAHVERYYSMKGKPAFVEELINRGALLQCNTQAVTSSLLDGEGRWARKMIQDGYVSFLATDAHDLKNRSPQYKKAFEWVRRKCDPEIAERIRKAAIPYGQG